MRDWGLWLLQMIPALKRWIELGPRMAGRMQYTYEPGMAFIPELGGGVLFSQSFCARVRQGSEPSKGVLFTDDVIFHDGKKGLFQIVVFIDGGIDRLPAHEQAIHGLEEISRRLHPREATFFVDNDTFLADSKAKPASVQEVFRFATADEFSTSTLSNGRPYPHGYRENDMHVGVNRKTFAIVRSDRFVFATCNTRAELQMAARRLNELFPA